MSAASIRYGSARHAITQELHDAKLVNNQQLPLGFTDEAKPQPIGFSADTPILIVGSAGSMKQVSVIVYQIMHPEHTVILDLKGESYATCAPMLPHYHCYPFNPFGLFTEAPWFTPCTIRLNPLDVIEKDSPALFEEALVIAQNLIAKPSGGNGNAMHFYGKAVQILTAIITVLKENNHQASLVDVYQVAGEIRTDAFKSMHYPAMAASSYQGVRQVAEELLAKQEAASGEFESILSTMSNALHILGSPSLQMALSSPSSITPQEFCASGHINKLFLMIPAHLVEACAPVIRCIFASLTIAQQRKPQQRIHFLIDEAAQLSNFEAMPRMFSYGRGSKARVTAVFQNIGQGLQHYGKEGFDTLFANAQTKLILGVPSKLSAEMISEYLGKTTYEYHTATQHANAYAKHEQLMRGALQGRNVFETLPELRREYTAMHAPHVVSRSLVTHDELIRMPPDRGLMAFHGLWLNPYFYKKYPYFNNPAVAHCFLPNPYHPPYDCVSLPQKNGRRKTVPIISESVPDALAHLPQYSRGKWSYPKGYPPYKPSLWQRLRGKK